MFKTFTIFCKFFKSLILLILWICKFCGFARYLAFELYHGCRDFPQKLACLNKRSASVNTLTKTGANLGEQTRKTKKFWKNRKKHLSDRSNYYILKVGVATNSKGWITKSGEGVRCEIGVTIGLQLKSKAYGVWISGAYLKTIKEKNGNWPLF